MQWNPSISEDMILRRFTLNPRGVPCIILVAGMVSDCGFQVFLEYAGFDPNAWQAHMASSGSSQAAEVCPAES